MKLIHNIKVPTGNILVVQGDHGLLEMLSLGDYGQSVNIKADCLEDAILEIENCNGVEMDHTDEIYIDGSFIINTEAAQEIYDEELNDIQYDEDLVDEDYR